jgi:hypothetical protein
MRVTSFIDGSIRQENGEQIVVTQSRQLAEEFGNGYSRPNLSRMIRFAELFADGEIVSTLSRQLSWSHFVEKTETRMTTLWCSAIDREPLLGAGRAVLASRAD